MRTYLLAILNENQKIVSVLDAVDIDVDEDRGPLNQLNNIALRLNSDVFHVQWGVTAAVVIKSEKEQNK